jgi:hypothetical protein
MIQFAKTDNVTWDYTPVGYWSTLEVHVGIVIACLPALRALQHRLFPGSKKSSSYYASPAAAYGYHSRSGIASAGFSSNLAKKLGRKKGGESKNVTGASQASMMRSRGFGDKEFIPLEDYAEGDGKSEGGASGDVELCRGTNNTLVGRGDDARSDEATFLDDGSEKGLERGFAIGVKKEYSVNVEYRSTSPSGRTSPR